MEEQLAPMYLSDDAVPLTSNCGIPGCLIGWLAGVEETGFPLVDYQDNAKGPLPARYTISPGSGGWKAAWSANSHVVLIFELGDPVRPIIIGVMRSPLEEVIEEMQLDAVGMEKLDVKLDRKQLILDATDQIVLRCGKGSIAIHRDGKIIIKGTQLVSRSSGVNKIKGSAVKIN
jgi:hypothetical protein